MNIPTEQQVREALEQHATPINDGWHFRATVDGVGPHTYDHEAAMAIVEASLILCLPITHTITGKAWGVVVRAMADLEQRIRHLEGPA